jgi:AcrR family transcriptional regulator
MEVFAAKCLTPSNAREGDVVYPDSREWSNASEDRDERGRGAQAGVGPLGGTRRPVGTHYGGGLRSDLIQAALQLIDEEGADRLSLRAVARRVGVSWAAPAHYFGDKEELFTAIAVEGLQLLADQVMNTAPFRGGHDPDQAATVAKLYAQFATDHPARFEVMCRRALLRSEDPRVRVAEDRLFLALGHLIAMSQRAGWRTDQDTESLAATAWCLAHGYCALSAQGSLARQFFATSPPPVERLTATLLG